MSKSLWQKWEPRLVRVLTLGLWLGWVLLFVVFFYAITRDPAGASDSKVEKLRVYGYQRAHYVEWDRDEALQFGFGQLAASFNYLFVAAAAILGFIGKMTLHPFLEANDATPLPRFPLRLLRHAAIGCCFSIFYGFVGYLYFNEIPSGKEFSIYEELSSAQLCQLTSFFAAVLLFLWAIARLISHQLKTQRGDHR